jgi:hypothetical protein
VKLHERDLAAFGHAFGLQDESCASGAWQVVSNTSQSLYPGFEAILLNPDTSYELYGARSFITFARRLSDPARAPSLQKFSLSKQFHERSLWLYHFPAKRKSKSLQAKSAAAPHSNPQVTQRDRSNLCMRSQTNCQGLTRRCSWRAKREW